MLDDLKRHAQLTILPGKPTFSWVDENLYNQAYNFWVRYWTATRQEVGLADIALSSDDFLRHDLVNVLLYKGEVIGMINCTFLDFGLGAAASHSYVLAYFDEHFRDSVQTLGLRRLATLENIFLDPSWRSARVGFSLGAVLMANALRKASEVGCDGVFGAPRKDAPTARICYDLGARPVTRDRVFHGKPTDLCIWRTDDIKRHPVREVNALAEYLWISRTDTLGATERRNYQDVA